MNNMVKWYEGLFSYSGEMFAISLGQRYRRNGLNISSNFGPVVQAVRLIIFLYPLYKQVQAVYLQSLAHSSSADRSHDSSQSHFLPNLM